MRRRSAPLIQPVAAAIYITLYEAVEKFFPALEACNTPNAWQIVDFVVGRIPWCRRREPASDSPKFSHHHCKKLSVLGAREKQGFGGRHRSFSNDTEILGVLDSCKNARKC
jgi:hypothetical protein